MSCVMIEIFDLTGWKRPHSVLFSYFSMTIELNRSNSVDWRSIFFVTDQISSFFPRFLLHLHLYHRYRCRLTDLRRKCRLTGMFNLLSKSVTLVSSVIVDLNEWYWLYLIHQRLTWKDDALEEKWYQWTCPKNSNSVLLFNGINVFDQRSQHGRELVHK